MTAVWAHHCLHAYICIGPIVPSDQAGTGAKKTVIGSIASTKAKMGDPSMLAPQLAASVWGRTNLGTLY